MTWIQFIDQHAEGLGFLALIAMVSFVFSVGLIASAVVELMEKRK